MTYLKIKTFSPTSHKIKAVIYGASGSGKTFFSASAPKPIFASAEGGLLSTGAMKKKIDFVEVKTIDDLRGLLVHLRDQEHDYETVVIDSISEINEIIKEGIERKRGRAMQLQDWGELSKNIKAILRGFRDLDMHTIFIAQEKVIDNDGKIQKIVPSLNGKSADEIAYFMDIVGYAYISKAEGHRIMTLPHELYLTKDRTNLVGNDAKLDFSEWVKLVEKMKLSKEMKEKTVDLGDEETPPPAAPAKKEETPPAPPAKSEKKINPDQTRKLFVEWNKFVKLSPSVEKEKSEAIRKATLKRDFGKTSTTQLTEVEAADFIDRLVKANMKLETKQDDAKSKEASKTEKPEAATEAEAIKNADPETGEIKEKPAEEKSETVAQAEELFGVEAEDVDLSEPDESRREVWEARYMDCKTGQDVLDVNTKIKAFLKDGGKMKLEEMKKLAAFGKEIKASIDKAAEAVKAAKSKKTK